MEGRLENRNVSLSLGNYVHQSEYFLFKACDLLGRVVVPTQFKVDCSAMYISCIITVIHTSLLVSASS